MKIEDKILTKEYYNIHRFICAVALIGFSLIFFAICLMKIVFNYKK